jgi:hypothetical protein
MSVKGPFPTVNRALLVLTKLGKAAILIPALSWPAVISPIFTSCDVLNRSRAFCSSELVCAIDMVWGETIWPLSRIPKILSALVTQFWAPTHDNKLVSLCTRKDKVLPG